MLPYKWKQISLSLAIGIALGLLLSSQTARLKSTIRDLRARLANHELSRAKEELAFRSDATAEIFDQNGFQVSVHGFKCSDGGTLSYSIWLPRASARADDEFEKPLADADIVVLREAVKNTKGEAYGQRAIALFWNRYTQTDVPTVMWTDGPNLRSIASASLYDALVFEKRILAGLP